MHCNNHASELNIVVNFVYFIEGLKTKDTLCHIDVQNMVVRRFNTGFKKASEP